MTFKSAIFAKSCQDFVLHPIGEVGVVVVAAQIFKRQHSDAFVEDTQGRACRSAQKTRRTQQ